MLDGPNCKQHKLLGNLRLFNIRLRSGYNLILHIWAYNDNKCSYGRSFDILNIELGFFFECDASTLLLV
jgi:hypothetical protein